MDQDDSVFEDEVPRFWFSRRWRLAVFSCVALLISTSQRVCLDVALVSMLNHTALDATVSTNPPVPPSSTLPPLHHQTSGTSQRRLAANLLQRPAVDRDRLNVTSLINESVTATEATYLENSPTSLHSTSQQNTACRNVTEVEFLVIAVFSYQEEGDLEWSQTEIHGVLDSFYWADVLTRFPAGVLSQRYGGKRVLGFSLLIGSLSTVLVPLTSRVHFSLVVVLRFVTGCTVAAALPAVSFLLGRWSPIEERSMLFSIANTGSFVCGSTIILPLAGLLCQYGFDGGWPSVFYVFGGLGMLWFVLWMVLTVDCPTQDGGISHDEKEYIAGCLVVQTEGFNTGQDILFPWPVVLTSLPVLVLALCQLSHEMSVYILVRLVPIYFRNSLKLDIKQNTMAAMLPGLSFWCLMMTSAGAADRLQAYGVLSTSTTRKLINTIGAVVTAAMLASMSALADNCSVHWLGPLSMLAIALAFNGLQLGSGCLVAHLDLASRHAAVISGLTGFAGSLAYFVMPALTRLLMTHNQLPLASTTSSDWSPASPPVFPSNDSDWRTLFIIVACLHVISALTFLLFGTSLGRHQLHVANPGVPLHSMTQPLDQHISTPCPDDANIEHRISVLGEDEYDAQTTADDNDDDERRQLQSESYYNSVSSPASAAPTFFSSADDSEVESVDYVEQYPSAAANRNYFTNNTEPSQSVGKTRNGGFRRSPICDVDQLSESVL